jgi:hypothetical protein
MKSVGNAALRNSQGETQMHDLLIALSFIAMVLSPAVVAAYSGKTQTVSE